MSELQFNVLVLVALFMEDRRCDTSEPVSRHTRVVAHSINGEQQRVVADGLASVSVAGKQELSISRNLP
jgi:hypothetical protein